MKCPHCGKAIPMPTARQQEAYRLVYIFQCTQAQAGVIMGIKQKNVSILLYRLEKLRPDLFGPENLHIKRKKPFRFYEKKHSQPKYQF